MKRSENRREDPPRRDRAAREQSSRVLLEDLQRGLEGIYRLDPAPAVGDFLLPPGYADGRHEQLLIFEDDDVHLGLAIDFEAVQQLAADHVGLHNLPHFSLVVEGVSHFLHVVYRARHEQKTSALELELQSEVDKFVAVLLLARRCPRLPPSSLRQRLYSDYLLLDGLSPDEQHRYHNAARWARRYARHLEERFIWRSQLSAMVYELRQFYRLSRWAKQAHIARF